MKTLLLFFCLLGFRADEISEIEVHKVSFEWETIIDVSCADFHHFGGMIDTFHFFSTNDKVKIIQYLNASKKIDTSTGLDVRAKIFLYHLDGKKEVICLDPTGELSIGNNGCFLNTSLRDFVDSLKTHFEK